MDTVVTVSKAQVGSNGTQRTERFTVRINGSALRTVDIVLPQRQSSAPQYGGCASWYVSDPSVTSCLETATPFTYAWRDSVATTASVAMYPTGDTIVLAVAQDSFAFNIGAPQGNGSTWERPYGDYSNTVRTLPYFIPVQGGSIRTASVLNAVEALGVSEDGLHFVAQVRNRFWSKYTTTNLGFATARHNLCAANYFLRSGAFSLGSQTQRRSPWASNTPCVPGSGFAP